jgi:hypothetical protein
MEILVVPKNTRSEPTSLVKVPPAEMEGLVDMPGGMYIRLMAVPEEKSRYMVKDFRAPAGPVVPVSPAVPVFPV